MRTASSLTLLRAAVALAVVVALASDAKAACGNYVHFESSADPLPDGKKCSGPNCSQAPAPQPFLPRIILPIAESPLLPGRIAPETEPATLRCEGGEVLHTSEFLSRIERPPRS